MTKGPFPKDLTCSVILWIWNEDYTLSTQSEKISDDWRVIRPYITEDKNAEDFAESRLLPPTICKVSWQKMCLIPPLVASTHRTSHCWSNFVNSVNVHNFCGHIYIYVPISLVNWYWLSNYQLCQRSLCIQITEKHIMPPCLRIKRDICI